MSSMLIPLAALSLYAVWRLFQAFTRRSPLDNIPGPASASILWGNTPAFFNHNNWDFVEKLVETYSPVSAIHGFLGAKWLHVYDPKAIHSILVKDVSSYRKGSGTEVGAQLLLGPGLLATNGEQHKRQRKMLNPVFSAAYMRTMTPFFHEVVGKLRDAIEARISAGAPEIDIAGWMARAALELVGQGGLGHSFDPLVHETKDDYTEAVKALIPVFAEVEWIRFFLPFVNYLGPAWFRRMLLDLVPHKGVQRLKRIVDVMHRRSLEIYHERKAAALRGDDPTSSHSANGQDVMSVLLRANIAASADDKLPDEEVIAQMSTFILAGVDTTSNALSRILHLLAEHPDIQAKLRAELQEAYERYGDKIPYNELMQLPYLDAVCRETLRLHSPVTFVGRETACDTILPFSTELRGVDGTLMTEVVVPKGTVILLNNQACNVSKALWGEDAHVWRPERWLQPLPREVEEARVPGIYANLMTFSAGSYSCIGFKFSQLEMKVVLSTLVRSFKFGLPDKPVTWNSAAVVYPTMGGPDNLRAEMFLKVKLA
ncbi:cytochrome P450 [Pilatotrama ljubarskyi]|nr:cytochrome P450 [Pilatotrama ljubarskyi]